MSTITVPTSDRYREAVQAIIAADTAFWQDSLREAAVLMPHTVSALILRVNDTPRLAFDAYLDESGEEHEAEEIDDEAYALGLFDALDEIAMQLGVHDSEDAASWLISHEDGERFLLRREDVNLDG